MPPPPSNPTPNFYQRAGRAVQGGGVFGVLTSLQRMKNQAEQAGDAMESLNAAMAIPAVAKAAGETMAASNATRALNAQVRQRVELEARRAAVSSGQYGREIQSQKHIYREQQRVYELERRAQYQARFGRVGGYLAHQANLVARNPLARLAVGVAGGVATAGAGMAMNGFQGTVEWNRLQLEIKMISRELAGAMKPAIEWVTGALQKLRKWLERLGPEGQDRMMAGLTVGGGLLGVGLARAGLGALGLGSMMRSILPGIAGAAPVAAGAGVGLGGAVAGTAAAGALARGGGAAAAGRAAGLMRYVGPVGLAAAGLYAAAETSDRRLHKDESVADYYSRKRKEGRSVLGAAWEVAGTGLGALGREVFGGEEKFVGDPDEKERRDRRRVTIADSGFDEIGHAKMRMTNAMALISAADRDGASGGELAGLVKEILKKIEEATAAAKAAPKPPMPGR